MIITIHEEKTEQNSTLHGKNAGETKNTREFPQSDKILPEN